MIGGGFAGATCARAAEAPSRALAVTLVEPNPTFTACPFSNGVIAGLRDLRAQQFGYDGVREAGVDARAASRRPRSIRRRARVTLGDGTQLAYDRLVLAPGIDMRFDALPGYTRRPPRRCRMPGRPARRRCCCAASSRRWRMAALVVISAPANPVPLPARPLRAREPDRPLPEDQEAALQADRPRRQGRVLQAAPVPERLEGALSRHCSNGCRCRRAAR